jgi:hypothetical protein
MTPAQPTKQLAEPMCQSDALAKSSFARNRAKCVKWVAEQQERKTRAKIFGDTSVHHGMRALETSSVVEIFAVSC